MAGLMACLMAAWCRLVRWPRLGTAFRATFLALMCPTGSGKTTQLNLIGGLFPAMRAARLPVTSALREL